MVPMFGPPTYFITINPADVSSPLMCYFAGADVKISLTDPDNPAMPTLAYRAHLVARDPVASARFFHRTICAFIQFLVGYDPELLAKVETERFGVLGDVIAYYCSTESQNRGTPHMHGLFWSHGALHPDEFEARLRSANGDAFRKRVLDFWDDCVSESVPMEPATDLEARPYNYERAEPMVINDKPVVKTWQSEWERLLGLYAEQEQVGLATTFESDSHIQNELDRSGLSCDAELDADIMMSVSEAKVQTEREVPVEVICVFCFHCCCNAWYRQTSTLRIQITFATWFPQPEYCRQRRHLSRKVET